MVRRALLAGVVVALWAVSAGAQLRGSAAPTDGVAGPDVYGAGRLWTVAWPFCPTYDTIAMQEAIDLASDGDVIYAHGSLDSSFVIDGKSLTIFAEDVTAGQPFEIKNLGPHQRVVMRGVDGEGLVISDNEGSILIEDAELRVADPGPFTPEQFWPAVRVTDSVSVTFARVDMPPSSGGATALFAVDSNVNVLQSTLRGSPGVSSWPYNSHGGSAVWLVGDSSLVATGSQLFAGNSAQSCDSHYYCYATGGGHGVYLRDAEASVWLLQTLVLGGAASADDPYGGTASDGLPIYEHAEGNLIFQGRGQPRALTVSPGVVAEVGQVTLSVDAPDGDLVFLLMGAGGDPFFVPQLGGVLLPAASFEPLGVGSFALTYDVPEGLVPAAWPLVLTLQTLHLSASGFSVTAGSYLMLLDEGDVCPLP